MNRITAILLAMVALLVHVLVVHRDPGGAFAYAYESAHVAFTLGANWIEHGRVHWSMDPASGALEGGLWSYPSPLLVWIAAAFEAVSLNVDRAMQAVGILGVLATVFLSTRFDTDRIAGVIPALLLVSSGATAAAGASGTEWPLAMFALSMAFVALEHGRTRFAALALVILVLVRPEGLFVAAALAVQTAWRSVAPGREPEHPSLWAFLPALAAAGLAHMAGSSLLRDAARGLRFEDAYTVKQGLCQLRDFMVGTVTPTLLVFPIYCLLRGNLSGVGRRALALTATWCAAAALMGGGPAAFAIAFTPSLPISFIAIQQGMARILDTYLKSRERLVWVSLSLAILGSLLGSRFPGDLGRIGLRRIQESVFTATARAPLGRSPLLARSSLFSEIRLTNDLRRIGQFLASRLPASTTVMTPWPGVLAATSNAHIIDAFGRTVGLGTGGPQSWSPEPGHFDAVAALTCEPEYIVPAIGGLEALLSGQLDDLLPDRLFALDPTDGPELRARARELLADYEVVVTPGGKLNSEESLKPLLLLRRVGIEVPVALGSTITGSVLRVSAGFGRQGPSSAKSGSLPEVFDAMVTVTFADGRTLVVDPGGRPLLGAQPVNGDQLRGLTLAGIVIDPRWQSAVTLAEIELPTSTAGAPGPVRVEARLLHHRLLPDDPRADAAPPLRLELR